MDDSCVLALSRLSPDYAYIPANLARFFLEEISEGGAGKVYFSSNAPCIVLKAGKSGPLIWCLKNRRISEGAILTKSDGKYNLHLVEMKSKLTQGEWAKAITQLEGMHLTALAVLRLLGVMELGTVTCYIAYKQDAMSANKSADMIFMKSFVGRANPLGGVDSWVSGTISLPDTGHAAIRKAQRGASNDADFGLIF